MAEDVVLRTDVEDGDWHHADLHNDEREQINWLTEFVGPEGGLLASFAGNTETYIDFTTKANGAAPAVMDSGGATSVTGSSPAPTIVSGKLVSAPSGAGGYGAYFQWTLPANGRHAYNEYTVPAGGGSEGTMCFGFWKTAYSGTGTVPESSAHVTIHNPTGTWAYYVGDGAGHLTVVKGGTFTKPPHDDVAVWRPELWIDEEAGIAYLLLPDGEIITVTDAEQQAAQVTAGVTSPKTFRAMDCKIAFIEPFATTLGSTALLPKFLRAGADSATAVPRGAKATDLGTLAKASTSIRSEIPPASAHASWSANSTFAIPGTSTIVNAALTVNQEVGPTGTLLVLLHGWIIQAPDSVVIWELDVNGSARNANAVCENAAQSGRHLLPIIVGGLTPGATVTIKWRHFCTVTGDVYFQVNGPSGKDATITAIPL